MIFPFKQVKRTKETGFLMFANQVPWIGKRLPSFMLREAEMKIILIVA